MKELRNREIKERDDQEVDKTNIDQYEPRNDFLDQSRNEADNSNFDLIKNEKDLELSSKREDHNLILPKDSPQSVHSQQKSIQQSPHFKAQSAPKQSNTQVPPNSRGPGRRRPENDLVITAEERRMKEFRDKIKDLPDQSFDDENNFYQEIKNANIQNSPYLNRPFDYVPTENSKTSDISHMKNFKMLNNDNLGYFSNDDRSLPNESFYNTNNLDEMLKLEQEKVDQQKNPKNNNNFNIKQEIESGSKSKLVKEENIIILHDASDKHENHHHNIPTLSEQFDIGEKEVMTDFDENAKKNGGLEIFK